MKTNKKIKIAISSLLGIIVLLFIVLVVHIALAKPVALDLASLQVSRIDFAAPLTQVQQSEITKNLQEIKGVTSDKPIFKNNVLVYFHNNRLTNSTKVYQELMAKGHYDAKPFLVPASLAQRKVCPAMNQNGFSYKFSRAIQRMFN